MRERFGWIECLRATQRLHNEASDPFLPFWSTLPSRMHKYFKMDVGDGWAKSVLLLLFVLEGWVWVMVIGFDAAEKQAVALQKHKQNTHIDTQGTQFSLKDETVKDSILREHPPSNKACKPPPEMRAEWVEESEVPPDPPAAAVVRGDKELGKRSRSLAFARAHARTHTHTHTHTHTPGPRARRVGGVARIVCHLISLHRFSCALLCILLGRRVRWSASLYICTRSPGPDERVQ